MTTFARPTTPTGYSDEDGAWITRVEWIARYCLPGLKPAQRRVLAAMLDGYTFVEGDDRKFRLVRGDEVIEVRAWLPSELLESAGESKRLGPPDRLGKRKAYTTRSYRLNGHAKMAAGDPAL
jgi:hypothetical protein